jgi:hypothetical protein
MDILEDSVLVPNGISLWVTDPSIQNWYLEYRNDGTLIFNGLVFDKGLRIFTIGRSEVSIFLKKWFETKFSLMVRSISRKNSDMDYELKKIIKQRDEWSMKNRFGFTYELVKKYLDLQNESEVGKTLLKNYIST